MFDVLNVYLEVIAAFLQGYCLQYFYGSFLESRLKKNHLCGLFIMAGYGLLKLSMNVVLPSEYGSARIAEKLALTFLILALFALCFYKVAGAITVFLVVTFMAISEISAFMVNIIAQLGDWLIVLWKWCNEQGYIVSAKAFITITIVLTQILLYVAFLLVLYLSLKQIVKSFLEKDYHLKKTELLFILTPSMVGLLICVLLRTIMFTVEDNVPELLYDRYSVLKGIVPAILILSLLSILYGVKLFQDMVTLNLERNSRIIMEKQIGSMQEHIEEMEHIYSGIRSMKHDMKNTLAVIMQLAGKKGKIENEELQAYLSELNQSFDKLDNQFKTGNTVVDTLLNMKYHEVIRTMPDIQVNTERLLFPISLVIQSYDIGVIVGNALDNAIEACRKLKVDKNEVETFIQLSSYTKGRMFFIEVENSFNGKVIKRKRSEFPKTDKADKNAHGMGLVNIKKTAEKYHGAVNWCVDGKVFTLSVMMKNEMQEN